MWRIKKVDNDQAKVEPDKTSVKFLIDLSSEKDYVSKIDIRGNGLYLSEMIADMCLRNSGLVDLLENGIKEYHKFKKINSP